MSNKKRSSRRKPKLPNKFNDYVMSNLSQKRYDAASNANLEEIRVDHDDMVEEIREISKEMDEGVFGCADKMNNDYDESTVSMSKNVEIMNNECLHVNSEENGDKMSNNAYANDNKDVSNKKMAYSYAKVAMDNKLMNNKLWSILTEILEDEREVVIFDEELVTLVEPEVLSLWVKLHNVPMEAWTDKGLSAIASRLACESDDLKSTRFFYTWSKSPQQPTTSIFKKLDRVVMNDGLLQKFYKAHALFLPYMSSDHCLAILIILNEVDKKFRAFKFTKYIADKDDFLPNVCKGWSTEFPGFHMFKVVKKLKALKPLMNKLNWGMKMECEILKEFNEAVMDEEKLLFQQAKVDCEINNLFTKTLTNEEAERMIVVTNEEIKAAMFDISDNKSTRLDSYTFTFLRKLGMLLVMKCVW
ncbi:hypothetical protein Tco_1045463 [Tanacetum coccineum]|uniref:Uncharacterized protein n=1 Tax=Tanacetum coccineum TaxID=301880 RepID=A0ABQ5GT79_9ASTR